jgi:hypothetical protein
MGENDSIHSGTNGSEDFGLRKYNSQTGCARKPAPRFKHIWVDLFTTNFYWIRCSQAEFVKRLELTFHVKEKEEPEGDGFFIEAENSRIGFGIIWISDKSDPGTLAHECLHAAKWMLERKRISFSGDTEEIYAYCVQYLFNKISSYEHKKKQRHQRPK